LATQENAIAPNESDIVSDVREFFVQYGATFVELATGKRSDVSALLEFYGAPLRFVGATFDMVMQNDADIVGAGGMGGEIDHLHRDGFGASELDKCDIEVLNPRAVLVDAAWLRRDESGALTSRFCVIYLMIHGINGWRVTSAISLADESPRTHAR